MKKYFKYICMSIIAVFLFFGCMVSADTITFGAFANTFTPDSVTLTSLPFTVVAQTEGGTEKEVYYWTYTLTQYTSDDYSESVGDSITVYNEASSNSLSEISFEYTECGTYYYTIYQNDVTEDGYHTDEEVRTFTVTVTLGDDDALVATASVSDDTFVVIVDPTASTVTLVAGKSLVDVTGSGQTLEAGQFTFQLVSDGEVIATATNDADGRVVFTYDCTEEGSFTLTVVEVEGDDEHITYADPVVFLLTVYEDDTGTLTGSVTLLSG